MVLIRRWLPSDIDYVTESIRRERWVHTRRDVERCWSLEPDGCFIAEAEGKRVGHVFSVSYGKTGWIGLLIVNSDQRGKGVGAVLMESAIKYLDGAGVGTILLEAVDKAIPLYRRLEFRVEFESLRFRRAPEPRVSESGEPNDGANRFAIREKEIGDIAEFDTGYFGCNRLRVLQSLYRDQPEYCFGVRRGRELLGYVMGRRILNAFWIGPWVSADSETAQELLRLCLDVVEGKTEIRLGMPAPNGDGLALMEEFGFLQVGKSTRMVRGDSEKSRVDGIYGIGGAEKG